MSNTRDHISIKESSAAKLLDFVANEGFVTYIEMQRIIKRIEKLEKNINQAENVEVRQQIANLKTIVGEMLKEEEQVEKWLSTRSRKIPFDNDKGLIFDFMSLPEEIQVCILNFLSVYERCDLFAVSKKFARHLLLTSIDNHYLFHPKLKFWRRLKSQNEESILFKNLDNQRLKQSALVHLSSLEGFERVSIFELICSGSETPCMKNFPLISLYCLLMGNFGGAGILGIYYLLDAYPHPALLISFISLGVAALLAIAIILEMKKQNANNLYTVNSVNRWSSRLFSQPDREIFYSNASLNEVVVKVDEEVKEQGQTIRQRK